MFTYTDVQTYGYGGLSVEWGLSFMMSKERGNGNLKRHVCFAEQDAGRAVKQEQDENYLKLVEAY